MYIYIRIIFTHCLTYISFIRYNKHMGEQRLTISQMDRLYKIHRRGWEMTEEDTAVLLSWGAFEEPEKEKRPVKNDLHSRNMVDGVYKEWVKNEER